MAAGMPSNPSSIPVLRRLTWLAAVFLLPLLAACAAPSEPALNDRIRSFIYNNQPTTGGDFVAWANVHLGSYTAQQVHTALHEEGKRQAERGHPNAVGVLSFSARAWADAKGLRYDPTVWLKWHEEAVERIREKEEQRQPLFKR